MCEFLLIWTILYPDKATYYAQSIFNFCLEDSQETDSNCEEEMQEWGWYTTHLWASCMSVCPTNKLHTAFFTTVGIKLNN